jgi:hypothetical protein
MGSSVARPRNQFDQQNRHLSTRSQGDFSVSVLNVAGNYRSKENGWWQPWRQAID